MYQTHNASYVLPIRFEYAYSREALEVQATEVPCKSVQKLRLTQFALKWLIIPERERRERGRGREGGRVGEREREREGRERER